jgi:uncharacterized protein (DUF1684 family)
MIARKTLASSIASALGSDVGMSERSQRHHVLVALRKRRTLNTIQLEDEYGVRHQPRRIKDLIDFHDFNIFTEYLDASDPDGRLHRRIAHYTLLPGKYSERPESQRKGVRALSNLDLFGFDAVGVAA